jgi:hypothetical protein
MRKNKTLSIKEAHMNTIADKLVSIQTSQDAIPSMPSWFDEVALIVGYLRRARVCFPFRFSSFLTDYHKKR